MSNSPLALTSFTVFPNLPFELRCMIWKATCVQRVVEIRYEEEGGFTPKFCDPIALKVCKESRKLILPSYPLCFGSVFHPARTRFNFSLDTLFVGNEIEDSIAHFFATFGPLEISNLQILALEDCYIETVLPFENNVTSQLRRMVTKFTALREVLIVYDVAAMTDMTLECADKHSMEFYKELPSALSSTALMVEPLPQAEDPEGRGFEGWSVKKCIPVYGWRRCPNGVVFSGLGLDEEDMSDDDNFGWYSGWSGYPPRPMMGHMEMFGPPMDSDDDYMFGYGDHFYDDDEEDEDDDMDEEDDENGSDAASVASLD